MANALGIKVREESGPEEAIAKSPTATTAFVGRTLRGPVNRPVRITSFAQFAQEFGGLWQPSPLGYAVEQYFDSGGREAYVVRVVNGARPSSLTLPTADGGSLVLEAKRPGTREFLRASVDYDQVGPSDSQFNLTIQRVRAHGTEQVEDQETFRAISFAANAQRPAVFALLDSELVSLRAPAPAARPLCTVDRASGFAAGYVLSSADGDDGAPLTDYDLIGSQGESTGLFALDQVDDFNFLCVPPLSREQDVGASTLLVAARYCKTRRAMLIVDPPLEWATADDALRGLRDFGFASENAFMFFPRVLAHDKLRGRFESFAPCGIVAGMTARADQVWPVWSAAEIEDAVLRPGFRPNCMVTEDRRRRLAAFGVNSLQATRARPHTGIPPRTLAGQSAACADWKYLSARRLALFIVDSIERGTRWVMFAAERGEIAARVHARISEFLESLATEGAFIGRPAEDAYYVICDERINPQLHDDARDFRVLFGFAGAREGAYHSYLITHAVTGTTVKPVTLNRLRSARGDLRDDEELTPQERDWVTRLAGRFAAASH